MSDNLFAAEKTLDIAYVEHRTDFPEWTNEEELALFLHYKMQPYNDSLVDVRKALDYSFSDKEGMGGILAIAAIEKKLVGAVVILKTGMSGFVPENLLVFVGVEPELRGQGIGRIIIEKAISRCRGNVKLHVEQDNPARRLYQRLGFKDAYVEMRYYKNESGSD